MRVGQPEAQQAGVAHEVPGRVGLLADHPAQGGEGEEARLARVAAPPPPVAQGGAPHARHRGQPTVRLLRGVQPPARYADGSKRSSREELGDAGCPAGRSAGIDGSGRTERVRRRKRYQRCALRRRLAGPLFGCPQQQHRHRRRSRRSLGRVGPPAGRPGGLSRRGCPQRPDRSHRLDGGGMQPLLLPDRQRPQTLVHAARSGCHDRDPRVRRQCEHLRRRGRRHVLVQRARAAALADPGERHTAQRPVRVRRKAGRRHAFRPGQHHQPADRPNSSHRCSTSYPFPPSATARTFRGSRATTGCQHASADRPIALSRPLPQSTWPRTGSS